ncbi:MAG: DUF2066 domain-containing protein [Gammaproteobacteria bacterium]|nr:DUF2066 domain-containing protein [Gammaproteobacteria bacterium]
MLDFKKLTAVAGGVLLLSALAGPLHAVTLQHLFEADVDVFGQTDDERRKAFAAALWDVLVKVTGDRSVPSRPEVQTLFRRAERLVQQYQYREIEAPVADAVSGPGEQVESLSFDIGVDVNVDAGTATSAPTHVLWIQFAPETVERHLSRLGIPLWGKERPETLVWLAVEDGRQRYLLGAGSDSDVHRELLSVAQQRGVPLLFPVMDVADRTSVRFSDVRGNFVQPVWDASRRYGVDSILAGNLTRTLGGEWQAQWTLHRRGNTSSWRVQSGDRTAGLLSGVEGVASVLSRELAVGYYGAGSGRTLLTIHEVDAIADYSQVLIYLRGLSLVKEVMVERVNEGRLTVALQLRGDPEDLQRTIALGDTLIAVRDVAGGDNPHRVLQYAYLP